MRDVKNCKIATYKQEISINLQLSERTAYSAELLLVASRVAILRRDLDVHVVESQEFISFLLEFLLELGCKINMYTHIARK